MPIVAKTEGTIKYDLKKTGIKGLENDWLIFNRLTVADKVNYGPKIYDPWRSHIRLKEKIDKGAENLPDLIRKTEGRTLDRESIQSINDTPISIRRNMAATYIMAQEESPLVTPGLRKINHEIDRQAVVDMFKEKIAGWNDRFFVDENGSALGFSKVNVNRLADELSVEEVMLPAMIFLFDQCSMKASGVDFLSRNTSGSRKKTGKSKRIGNVGVKDVEPPAGLETSPNEEKTGVQSQD
jgi:hypothetical protein